MEIADRGTPHLISRLRHGCHGDDPVLLRFEIRGDVVYLRINDGLRRPLGPKVPIAENIGPLSVWTPYVCFYVPAISRSEKVALVDVD